MESSGTLLIDTPIPEAYWVEPGFLLAGPYPTPRWAHIASGRLPALLQAGIQLFVDLTEPGEAEPYADQLGEQAYHLRIPIGDFSTPTPDKMAAILNVLDEALHRGWRVYLHCLGGIGRTGTVVGCYLVRGGLTGAQALERLQQLRANSAYAKSGSPETDMQRAMVLQWPVGQ
ncbi:MAG TPA: dual specificity protein phosphatase family protein [Anaerolineae bacterium]|nr:dual specificity protein phosphatase family protein [Anaerolineae bacterium]HQI85219.1 dual specificity protein phosphatase family protein [Anaerolineae bacterium]